MSEVEKMDGKDDGNGNEIIDFNKSYIQEYLGIEYAPKSCSYFHNGNCLLKPKGDNYKPCNNCIDLGGC